MKTTSGTDVMVKNDISGQVDLETKEEEVRPDYTPERLDGETFEDYKKRRKAVKKWQSRVRFTPSEDGLNRKQLRKKTRLRLTKKIRKVRKKYMYGMIKDDDGNLITNDITESFKKDINPIQYARMRKMGLTLKQYLNIAKKTEKNINEMIAKNEKGDNND